MEPAWMSAYMKWEIPRGTAGWVKTDEVMDLRQCHAGERPLSPGREIQRRRHSGRHHLQDVHGLAAAGKDRACWRAYVNRVTGRPAYARAQARENG